LDRLFEQKIVDIAVICSSVLLDLRPCYIVVHMGSYMELCTGAIWGLMEGFGLAARGYRGLSELGELGELGDLGELGWLRTRRPLNRARAASPNII
jgi:hypothetical protein